MAMVARSNWRRPNLDIEETETPKKFSRRTSVFTPEEWSESGFSVVELPEKGPSGLPLQADVFLRGQFVGRFDICARRESKERPNVFQRWLQDVPWETKLRVPVVNRVQLNLTPIQLGV